MRENENGGEKEFWERKFRGKQQNCKQQQQQQQATFIISVTDLYFFLSQFISVFVLWFR